MVDAPLTKWLDQVTRKHKFGTDTPIEGGAPPPANKVDSFHGDYEITSNRRQVVFDELRQMDRSLDGLLEEAKKPVAR